MTKTTKISVLKFVVENNGSKNRIEGKSIENLIEVVRQLPVKLEDKKFTRYSHSETNNELAMVFSDEIKTVQTIFGDIYVGVFLKRRGSSRPLEDGEDGSLVELKLQNDSHEIAEVSYFGIHKETGIVFMTYNPMVGGVSQFIDYLNRRIEVLRAYNINPDIPELSTAISKLDLYYIGFPESEQIFKDSMEQVQNLEFHIASDPDKLAQLFLFDDDNRDKMGMRLIREFAKESNCASITLKLNAEKPKKMKLPNNERKTIYPSLNKGLLVQFYDSTKLSMKDNKDNRFCVRGRLIDEDVRILDLVHSRLTYPMPVYIDDNCDSLTSYINAIPALIRAKIEEAKNNYGFDVD
jgi:hypothetical protein